MVNLLLNNPLEERDVADIRGLYLKEIDKECIWTGEKLKNNFEIDHIIPFSLWRNNDLWNLVPCSVKTNRDKRDKLPSRSLINKREEVLIHYWRKNNSFSKKRFFYEINYLLGKVVTDNSWEMPLFDFLKESIEITALQRRVPRWEP